MSTTPSMSKRSRSSFWRSVQYAFSGIAYAWRQERNVRVQLVAFVGALVLAWWLEVSAYGVALLVLASAAVLSMELLNSAVELFEDIVQPEHSQFVQHSKDMAAGAVLVVSVAAFLVGLLVFGWALVG